MAGPNCVYKRYRRATIEMSELSFDSRGCFRDTKYTCPLSLLPLGSRKCHSVPPQTPLLRRLSKPPLWLRPCPAMQNAPGCDRAAPLWVSWPAQPPCSFDLRPRVVLTAAGPGRFESDVRWAKMSQRPCVNGAEVSTVLRVAGPPVGGLSLITVLCGNA